MGMLVPLMLKATNLQKRSRSLVPLQAWSGHRVERKVLRPCAAWDAGADWGTVGYIGWTGVLADRRFAFPPPWCQLAVPIGADSPPWA